MIMLLSLDWVVKKDPIRSQVMPFTRLRWLMNIVIGEFGGSLPLMYGVIKVVANNRISSSHHLRSAYFKQWTNNQPY